MKDAAQIAYCNMGPWPVYVGFTRSEKAFKREIKRLGVEANFLGSTHANATTHILVNHGSLCCIITMQKDKSRSPEQVASLIAHEAVHVAQEVWKQLGEREPGAEAEAYLVQHIVQFCLQEAMKTGRTRRTESAA